MCPTAIDTEFQAWEFTEDELPQAVIFTDLQEKHIRTELAYFASKLVNTADNPESLSETLGTMQFNRGAMTALKHLLAMSINKRDEVIMNLQEQLNLH